METLERTPLTVVGAGPAGMLAASVAAEAGVDVTLIDDNRLPGGQSFRQSPPEFALAGPSAAHSGRADAATYYARVEHPRIRHLYNTSAWGVFEEGVLALATSDRTYALPFDRVVLATG